MFTSCPQKDDRRGRMNERNGGWCGGVGNWDMKERRANKSPSEEDDAFWLENSRGFSFSPFLSLHSLICVFLPSLSLFPLSLCHFFVLRRDLAQVNTLQRLDCCGLNCTHTHASMFWRQPGSDGGEAINVFDTLLRQHFAPLPKKMWK